VANLFSNSISTYAVEPQTGHLNLKGTVPSGGTNPRVIAVEPSGRFAYVGNIVSNDISVFAIDSNTGSLAMVGSPVPAGNGPRFIVVGPTGNLLYAVEQDSSQVSAFSINPNTGTLTLVGTPATTDDYRSRSASILRADSHTLPTQIPATSRSMQRITSEDSGCSAQLRLARFRPPLPCTHLESSPT
jgi:6-phosphogluconolactonase (cycloisomerase 2 family)